MEIKIIRTIIRFMKLYGIYPSFANSFQKEDLYSYFDNCMRNIITTPFLLHDILLWKMFELEKEVGDSFLCTLLRSSDVNLLFSRFLRSSYFPLIKNFLESNNLMKDFETMAENFLINTCDRLKSRHIIKSSDGGNVAFQTYFNEYANIAHYDFMETVAPYKLPKKRTIKFWLEKGEELNKLIIDVYTRKKTMRQ